ncbi:TetR/AcrR family transcriptional regulator, partial [Rathayibacter sp. AY1G9]|uniref:TetR/AcrR family transcriptional regulator n=1 Tax=Rathayibacter sp. AY1G9 TaxID=2080565 RepID=UPI0015E4948E
MPDRRESRSDILSAVVAVLSTRGAEHLSIRTVAAEAGVSVGAVQHHFPTKQALLAGAMARVEERFRERMRSRLEAEPSAEVRLRIFCDEIACVADEDVPDAIVWTAFASRAGTDPEIRAIHTAGWSRTDTSASSPGSPTCPCAWVAAIPMTTDTGSLVLWPKATGSASVT